MQGYNQHNIIAKVISGTHLQAVYHGLRLVWQAVRSCFGSGVWIGNKPWIGSEKWKGHR